MDWWYVGYLVIGVAVGVIALPWRGRDSELVHVAAFAWFWPCLLFWLAVVGVSTYWRIWWRYLDRRERERISRANEQE